MSHSFVHLRNHSEFSLIDGLLRVKPLVSAAKSQGMPAIAITDVNNLYALVKFQKAAFSAGIKPVFGVDVVWSGDEESDERYMMTLLAKNNTGYKNLLDLVSKGYTAGQSVKGVAVKKIWIEQHADGSVSYTHLTLPTSPKV